MSFAAAAFLAGLLVIAVPWWLHRRESSSETAREVSSLMLMRPGTTPVAARRVVRNRWLLALRMLLLTVLALAFAQPVLERALAPEAVAQAQRARLIVVDTSASMAADPGAARRLAREVVASLPPGTRAAVLGASHELEVAASLTADPRTLGSAIESLNAGAGRLSFDGLAGRVWALAATLTDEPVDVHVISDFQRTAMPEQFNALLAGAQGRMVLHQVHTEKANWMIDGIATGEEVEVFVRGIDTPQRRLDVVLSNAAGELARRPVTVPAGGRARATFPLPEPGAAGTVSGDPSGHVAGRGQADRWLRAGIAPDDALPGDDAAFVVLRAAPSVALPVFASHEADAQLEYLRAGVGAAAPRFRLAEPAARGPVAVLVDPGLLAGDRERLLARHLEEGGGVLMTVGPATRRAGRLPLTGEPVAAGRRHDEVRRVVATDSTHPVVAGVPRWQDVTVSRHLEMEAAAGAEVIASLDDGTPLLLERRMRAGRILVLLTALDPAWSTLVTRPAFVTLLTDALAYLAEDTLPDAAVAGQVLAIPARNVQFFDLQGNRMLALGDTVARASVRLARPGIFTMRTPTQTRLLAVNPELRESDLHPADAQLLARWSAASRALVQEDGERSPAEAGRASLPLAPWLLALLAVLAVVEPLAANAARLSASTVRGGDA